jgi:hypothetical protein
MKRDWKRVGLRGVDPRDLFAARFVALLRNFNKHARRTFVFQALFRLGRM